MSAAQAPVRELALAGNPNVGKSSLFNALTGLHQHTGNWPGKTAAVAQGTYCFAAARYAVTDLPGTYSLTGSSEEERIAAEYLRAHTEACVVAVCDATCLARSLALALQLMQRCRQVIVCVNLMDAAHTAGLRLNLQTLQALLGVPVIGTSASDPDAIRRLRQCIRDVQEGFVLPRPKLGGKLNPAACVRRARELAEAVTVGTRRERHEKLDRFLTGRFTGAAVCAALLFVLFWLTLAGSNFLSDGLQVGFDTLQGLLERLCIGWPAPIQGALLHGIYATAARVVAVMLPPAALFFLLFSLLEDVGYLPRAAFLADQVFAPCGSSGRQALSLCMGLGCNAVGVVGCRIMPSRQEKCAAIVTNSLIPCNGRFPLLLTMGAVLLGRSDSAPLAGILLGVVLLGFGASLAVTKLVRSAQPREHDTLFVLELPPFRRPQLKKILYDALLDKTLHVLFRALVIAAPAGLVLWMMGAVQTGQGSLLQVVARALDGVGRVMGLDGAILLSFVFALPANELTLPVLLMLLTGSERLGALQGVDVAAILRAGGITPRMALCCLLFCLFHWPCGTTLRCVRRETNSVGWTLLAAALPTALGIGLCCVVNQVCWLFGLA